MIWTILKALAAFPKIYDRLEGLLRSIMELVKSKKMQAYRQGLKKGKEDIKKKRDQRALEKLLRNR